MISKAKNVFTKILTVFPVEIRPFFSVIAMGPSRARGPLLCPLKPTAFLKHVGPLKSMAHRVIVPSCPPSRWPCNLTPHFVMCCVFGSLLNSQAKGHFQKWYITRHKSCKLLKKTEKHEITMIVDSPNAIVLLVNNYGILQAKTP